MKILTFIKQHIIPILLVIGGIIDQTTELLAQLLLDLSAPIWAATVLRILVISFGAFKLYITDLNAKRK